MEFVLSSAAFIISYISAGKGCFAVSGSVLIIAGFLLYFMNVKRSGSMIDPAALFSVSWISASGVSCLKLSNLQSDWNIRTWIVIFITYEIFLISYRLFMKRPLKLPLMSFQPDSASLLRAVIALTSVSCGCFILEAVILGYVPLFTVDTPHAYSYFHISGVHYFTVLCVLVPALSVLYLNEVRNTKKTGNIIAAAVCDMISLILPVLMVSRYQLVFSCMLAFITFLIINSSRIGAFLKPRYIISFVSAAAALILLYILITVERAHSIEYLNGIFDMKNRNTPIFITQPYIYIANNFDNLNCLTDQLPEYTYGLRELFPVFALSGLKFLKPELVSLPLYVTKEELTTVTIIYDAFYDFGIPGVAVFSALLGFIMSVSSKINESGKNPLYVLISAQLTGYLCLSFFTTWFSNPTTWFYLIICIAMNIYLWYNDRNVQFGKEG